MIERIIYQCEHCNRKRYFNKTQMKVHEENCWYKPENKTCVTCYYNNFYGESNLCALTNIKNEKPIVNCVSWNDKIDMLYGEE